MQRTQEQLLVASWHVEASPSSFGNHNGKPSSSVQNGPPLG